MLDTLARADGATRLPEDWGCTRRASNAQREAGRRVLAGGLSGWDNSVEAARRPAIVPMNESPSGRCTLGTQPQRERWPLTRAAAQQRNVKQVGVRLSSEERRTLQAACDALFTEGAEVSPGQLLCAAGLDESFALGFTTSRPRGEGKQPRGVWKNRPARRRPSELPPGEKRKAFTITIHPLHLQPIAAAAQWVGEKVPTFLWGALVGFLVRRKKAEPQNQKLQRIDLSQHGETRQRLRSA